MNLRSRVPVPRAYRMSSLVLKVTSIGSENPAEMAYVCIDKDIILNYTLTSKRICA